MGLSGNFGNVGMVNFGVFGLDLAGVEGGRAEKGCAR